MRLLFLLLGLTSAAPALPSAAPVEPVDPAFALTAHNADLARYFPGYLANGYVSALTDVRGTEPARNYMVALMDYAADDVSRPAAVPAWTEIDYSAGPTAGGLNWLNRAPLDAAHFEDYRQTLDMHGATLATQYRYVDYDKKRVSRRSASSARHRRTSPPASLR